ncbi:MAG: hypothetical protein ACK5RY_13625 [Dolichospermum sp.]|nr:hypothetical protein [Anabaena sp. 49628_E55]
MTREQGTGNREQGTGNREQGTGFAVSVSRTVLGNFTFRYLCRFFSVYLLILGHSIAVSQIRKLSNQNKIATSKGNIKIP